MLYAPKIEHKKIVRPILENANRKLLATWCLFGVHSISSQFDAFQFEQQLLTYMYHITTD